MVETEAPVEPNILSRIIWPAPLLNLNLGKPFEWLVFQSRYGRSRIGGRLVRKLWGGHGTIKISAGVEACNS